MIWFYNIINFAKRENLDKLFLLIVLMIGITTVIYPLFEPDVTMLNALWWSIVTLTTVGYGDISPTTIGGRIVGMFIMFFGIGMLGMFTATIASIFVERKQKRERGMESYNFEKHIILCQWNHRARNTLSLLRKDHRVGNTPIILIANLELKPVDDENLFFIQGEFTEENFKRAGIEKASTVIILGDDRLDPNARDAGVVLTTLTVESLNRDVYTIVELVNSANIPHCERANVNEVIVSSEFSSKLLSRAALDHGISKVISELLTSSIGSDLFKIPVPDSLCGYSFIDLFTEMKRFHNSITLGVQKGNDGAVVSNPPVDFRVESGDFLIIIANDG